MADGWRTVGRWKDEQPVECTVCSEVFSGREAAYLPAMCEREGCAAAAERGEPVEVVKASDLAAAEKRCAELRQRLMAAAWAHHQTAGGQADLEARLREPLLWLHELIDERDELASALRALERGVRSLPEMPQSIWEECVADELDRAGRPGQARRQRDGRRRCAVR